MTYLNICAVASQNGDHEKAREFAEIGIQECKNDYSATIADPN
jgi:hypothetical protein